MSTLHVRHVRAALQSAFDGKVDLSDCVDMKPEQQEQIFLSRALAAFSISIVGGVDADHAAAGIVDGFNDNGIDAVCFIPHEHMLYIAQSKWFTSGNGSPEKGDVLKYIQGLKDFTDGNFDKFNNKIKDRKAELLQALDDQHLQIVVIITYTGRQEISSDAASLLRELIGDMNDPTELATLEVLNLARLHNQVAGRAEGEPVNTEVMIHEWGIMREPYLAYYGQVEAGAIAEWWNSYQTRLFSKNLRNFKGSTEINQSITETATSTPEKFWYFNNGITVLCNTIQRKAHGSASGDRSSQVLVCNGMNIVNGAQTVGSIAQACKLDCERLGQARVLVRFISLEQCPSDFAVEVTRATNTQNKIELRDFASLDPEQERLRRELWLEGKEYVYKSGFQTPSADRGCDIQEATIALACANADIALSVQAKREISKLWENIEKPPYRLLFNKSLTGLRLWHTVEVCRAIENELRVLTPGLDGRERQVAVHGNRFLTHLTFQQVDQSVLGKPEFSIENLRASIAPLTRSSQRALFVAVEKNFSSSYPNSLFKNQTKCTKLSRLLDKTSSVDGVTDKQTSFPI